MKQIKTTLTPTGSPLRAKAPRSLILAMTSVFAALGAGAQTWDGGGADTTWTNALNWVGDAVPAQNSAILFNNASAPNLSNSLGQTFYVRSLTFGAAQTAPVTINCPSTNESLIFNPGDVVTVKAGAHQLLGLAAGANSAVSVLFTNNPALFTNTPVSPVLTVTRAGNVLTFSWPETNSYHRLQVQTNAANAGIGGVWIDYPGGGASPVDVPINPGTVAAFYRLVSTGPVYTFNVENGASLEIAARIRRAVTNAGVMSYVKTGGGTLYLSKDNGGGQGWMITGDNFTVLEGILKLDQRARGNSAMILTVSNGATLQVIGEQALPSGYVRLAGTGVSGNGALEFIGGLNLAGAGTNRIETGNVILTANTSIGASESGQLNKCGLGGGFTMTKVGAGELELGTTLYMTNPVPWSAIIVSNGMLKVSGGITQPIPITVVSGATLRVTAGFGTNAGPVVVQAGGKVEGTGTLNGTVTVDGELAPGVGSTIPGTLFINNSLTLNAGSTTTVQVAAASNDQVTGLTSVQFGGTLDVTDISLGGISSGQTFQLFNIGGSGNFTSVTGTPSIGGTWSFNPATGVLTHVP